MTDSTKDTMAHKQKVLDYATDFCGELLERAKHHDDSKLESPEKEKFDLVGTKSHLSKSVYGSEEYKKSLEMLGDALKHHYEANSHHPQHYPDGIDGMDLLDLVEMYVDWKAAAERNKGGDLSKSIEMNRERFKMSDQLYHIFKNTVGKF